MTHSAQRPHFLVFGVPRSGTTLYFEIVADYLSRTQGLTPVEQFFNLSHHTPFEIHGRVCQEAALTPPDYPCRADEMERRMRLFRRIFTGCFVKLHPSWILPSHIRWLVSSHDWIFVERRNLFEQFLSFLISVESGIWFEPDGIWLEEKSLTASESAMKDFQSQILRYQILKKHVKPSRVLVYEDFLTDPKPESILKRLALDPNVRIGSLRLPRKQNFGNKLRYFTNADEITRTYRESFLQQLSPISKEGVTRVP